MKRNEKVKDEFQKDYNDRLKKSVNTEDTYDYIASIIEINSKNPKTFSPNLKMFFLNKINGIIKKVNPDRSDQEIDEWDSLTEDENIQIEKVQNEMEKRNVGKFIAELLKENIIDNIPLANAIFLCGISFLFGGNRATQNSMIAEINKDPEVRVFQNISNLITKIGKLILKNLDERNYVPSTSSQYKTTTIDNYDFYDQNKKFCDRKNVCESDSTD